jgi:hypothetical protein
VRKAGRPLWQLLLLTQDVKESAPLTCEECFTLLEYDIDLLLDGADLDKIRPAVYAHLSLCSECQLKLDEWMEKMGGK